jgi:hypothetical protein
MFSCSTIQLTKSVQRDENTNTKEPSCKQTYAENPSFVHRFRETMGFPHLLALFQGNQPVRRGRKVLSEDSAWAAVSFGCPASPPWMLLVRDRLGSNGERKQRKHGMWLLAYPKI